MKRIFIICLIFASCNPAKQVLRNQSQFETVGQKWLEKNPCVNDSVAIYIPGKRDSKYIEIPSGISGDEHISVVDLLDSVRQAADYIDRTCQPRIAEAYRKGYQTAIGRVKTIKIAVPVHDTVRVVVRDRQFAAILEQNLKVARESINEQEKTALKARNQRNLWFFLFLIAILLLVVVSYHKINKKWH
jgi:hypothetical protein